jgi:hypothetical protein
MRSLSFALLVAIGSMAACSSSSSSGADGGTSGGGACTAYQVPSSFSATTPTTSFKNDVLPIFTGSCGKFTECHGASGSSNQAGLFLGNDAARVYANLVGVPASNYASMMRVKASDPSNSYLMHKLDGDACSLPSCTGVCENTMPDDSPPGQGVLLGVATERDVIRRWIAQGAPNN